MLIKGGFMVSDIAKRIKLQRQKQNISIDKLAKILGKNRATVYRYENGDIEKLPMAILEPLAKALHTTPAYLMGWQNDENLTNIDIVPIKKIRLPVLGSVACGQPIFAEENLECYLDAIDNIKADFALWAKGDSMVDARINDGDLVFIKQQDMVENGEIAAVLIEDEATLKKVFYEPNKNRLMLVAANKNYQPFIYEGQELEKIKILGKAVAFQSNL